MKSALEHEEPESIYEVGDVVTPIPSFYFYNYFFGIKQGRGLQPLFRYKKRERFKENRRFSMYVAIHPFQFLLTSIQCGLTTV